MDEISNMNPIPLKIRKDCESDPYYKKCCLTGLSNGKIDWHHCFTFKGSQINEKWNILPILARKHNYTGDPDSVHNCKETKEKAELIALRRADESVFKKYERANLKQRLIYLEKKYGQ